MKKHQMPWRHMPAATLSALAWPAAGGSHSNHPSQWQSACMSLIIKMGPQILQKKQRGLLDASWALDSIPCFYLRKCQA